jgi:hypothetical protein
VLNAVDGPASLTGALVGPAVGWKWPLSPEAAINFGVTGRAPAHALINNN